MAHFNTHFLTLFEFDHYFSRDSQSTIPGDYHFKWSLTSREMVDWWFGARWFGFLGFPYERDWDS